MVYTELTRKAMNICYDAHHGVKDKSGVPYVFHPFHVAEQMDTEYEVCTALLHDVVEDTDYTLEDLRKAGFPEEIVSAVACLTKDKNQPYMEYIDIVKKNPLATKVKLADLAHNSDASRLNCMDEHAAERLKKYAKAKKILEENRE